MDVHRFVFQSFQADFRLQVTTKYVNILTYVLISKVHLHASHKVGQKSWTPFPARNQFWPHVLHPQKQHFAIIPCSGCATQGAFCVQRIQEHAHEQACGFPLHPVRKMAAYKSCTPEFRDHRITFSSKLSIKLRTSSMNFEPETTKPAMPVCHTLSLRMIHP